MPIHPAAKRHLLRKLLILVVLFVAVATLVWWRNDQNNKKSPSFAAASSSSAPAASASFDKNQYSINDPASLWAIVNKGRVLPSDYTPANLVAPSVPLRLSAANSEMHLRQDAATAMVKLFTAAANDGLHLMLASGYRSYSEQISVYNAEVQSNGQAVADQESARPGHSEHQTGLAADLEPASRNCELSACFADTPEGKWLAANTYKYGFVIRYQKDKSSQTGYTYEPWHVRYVGLSLAEQISKTGQTLEQFFSLPNYVDYPPQMYQLKT